MEAVYVTLVNRSSKDLVGRYDGREHIIKANSRSQVPMHLAVKFKEQNPIMGSMNVYSGDKEYLLGIEDFNDPVDPIEQSSADSVVDLQTIYVPAGYKLEVLPGRTGNPRANFNKPIAPQVVGFEPNNDIGGSRADKVELEPVPSFEKP